MVFLSGCAVTDFDPNANFGELRRFSWGKAEVTVSNPSYRGELIEKRIKAAVLDEFNKKGIKYVERNPDFVVNYSTYTEKKQESRSQYRSWGYPYGFGYFPLGFYPYYGWGAPFGMGYQHESRDYTEGTLVLDIVDVKSGETIWRGSVKGKLDDGRRLQKQIAKGVKAILRKYPSNADDGGKLTLPDKQEVS